MVEVLLPDFAGNDSQLAITNPHPFAIKFQNSYDNTALSYEYPSSSVGYLEFIQFFNNVENFVEKWIILPLRGASAFLILNLSVYLFFHSFTILPFPLTLVSRETLH